MSFRHAQSGFTLLEVLIAAFVIATVTVAITGLALLTTRSAIRSEVKNVAQAIANEQVESARTLDYNEIEYDDVSVQGKIIRQQTLVRNDVSYQVYAFIQEVDDPADGTGDIDFKKVLFRVTPLTGDQSQSTAASTVVSATIFSDSAEGGGGACIPGTITCENPRLDCIPGAPAGCPDGAGDYTLDCPADGICPGSGTAPFVACPASGKCSDYDPGAKPSPSPTPPNQSCSFDSECDEAGGEACIDNLCQQAWCPELGAYVEVAEKCLLGFEFGQACNDGVDNDGDGAVDGSDPDCQAAARWGGNGVDDDADGQIDEPDEWAIFQPAGACQRQQCPNIQRWARLGPVNTSSECAIEVSCGVAEYFWRGCYTECNNGLDDDGDGAVDMNDNECLSPQHATEGDDTPMCADGIDNDGAQGADLVDPSCSSGNDDDEFCPRHDQNACQEQHACPAYTTCLPVGQLVDATCTGDNCCPDNKPACAGISGTCFECVVNPETRVANVESCPNLHPDTCNLGGAGIECQCRNGTCVQCTSSWNNLNVNPDPRCSAAFLGDKDYCAKGTCVECTANDHCPADEKCQLDATGEGDRYTCVPADELSGCSDGVDNDLDFLIDAADPGCHTDLDSNNPDSYDPNTTENERVEDCLTPAGDEPALRPRLGQTWTLQTAAAGQLANSIECGGTGAFDTTKATSFFGDPACTYYVRARGKAQVEVYREGKDQLSIPSAALQLAASDQNAGQTCANAEECAALACVMEEKTGEAVLPLNCADGACLLDMSYVSGDGSYHAGAFAEITFTLIGAKKEPPPFDAF